MTNLPEWAKSMIAPTAVAMCRDGGFDPYETMPNDGPRWGYYVPIATAALAVALPLIAEHMAGVADDHYLSTPDDDHQLGQADCASNIAAAIRQEATPRKH